jgi:hypothetical protein
MTHEKVRQLSQSGCSIALVLILHALLADGAVAQLYGVDYDSGQLYTVSTSNASLSLVGSTGVPHLGSLVYRPSDHQLYGFTVGDSSELYRINPTNANATLVAPLDNHHMAYVEGDMTIASNGTVYACCMAAFDWVLFTADLDTGTTTGIGRLGFPGPFHYPVNINGLAWRGDNMLVATYRDRDSLITINPTPTSITSINLASTIAELAPTFGTVGGMASAGNTGYFSTSGPGDSVAGSNELHSFNLFTGETALVGSFAPTITGTGLSGLALVTPEPASIFLLSFAGTTVLSLARRR